MATVNIIASTNEAFKAFAEQADAFEAKAIDYDGPQSSEPKNDKRALPAFIFNQELFVQLQVYIKSTLLFPPDENAFKKTYPLDNFQGWLNADQHEVMAKTLSLMYQHCATYDRVGIKPLIQLSQDIAEFSMEAANTIEKLKKEFNVICDERIPVSSDQFKRSVRIATTKLDDLTESGNYVHDSCQAIVLATQEFASQTGADELQLTNLNNTLETYMPQHKIDDALAEKMKSTTDKLMEAMEKQKKEADNLRNGSILKWFTFVPGVIGGVALVSSQVKQYNLAKDAREANEAYERALSEQNGQKLVLVRAIRNIKGLTNTINNVNKHIKEAQKSLENIITGISGMKTTAATLVRKLKSLSGQARGEDHGEEELVVDYFHLGMTAWNTVLYNAKQFAVMGIIQDAPETLPSKLNAEPDIVAAHYGGQDILTVARIQFNDGEKITIPATNRIAFLDPWQGNPKSLSVVYRFGNDEGSLRVLIRQESGTVYSLTAEDDKNGQLPTEVTRAHNLGHSSASLIKIHAVIYGLKQITDSGVYQKLYNAAAANESIAITNSFFNIEGANDPWPGVNKSGAVVYSINGVIRSISGKEHSQLRFSF